VKWFPVARKTDSSDEKLDPSLIHKKKARRRLVGAVAFLGAVGVSLPFLLDSEPKPATQEVQIRVPAREPMVGAVPGPVAPQAKAGASNAPVVPVVPLEPSLAKDDASKEFPTPSRIDSKAADGKRDDLKKDESKKDESKKDDSKKDDLKKDDLKKDDLKKDAAKKAEPKKPDPKKDDAKKDEVKKDASKKSDEAKAYRVQIGAFSSEDSAAEQQSKASKLGLKAYTEKITSNGASKTRVRVGPFANREQAEQALAKLKLNGIDAALVAP
jgi:DedD protein